MHARILRAAMILVSAACLCVGLEVTHAQAPYVASAASGAGRGQPLGVGIVYSQPPRPEGGLLQSSLRDPDGSATDQWVWDGFTLGWHQAITEIQWRGGHDPSWLGSGGPVAGFTIAIYASIPAGSQPDLSGPPLVHYELGDNAGETPAEVLGGVQTYAYHYTLPAPFQATAGSKYWVQIEAYQSGAPDWGLARASAGDGHYFRRTAGEGPTYQIVAGDAAMTLLGPVPIPPTASAHTVLLPLILRQ